MLDITLHVLLASLFTVGIRWTQTRVDYDVMAVGATNYIAAGVLGVVVLAISGAWRLEWSWPAVVTGGALGSSYFIAFFLLLGTLRMRGAAIAGALSRLAVTIPIGLAVLAWNERPSVAQWVGIGVSAAAVLLMNAPQRESNETRSWRGTLILSLFFLFVGASFASQEVFAHTATPDHLPVFLAAGFLMASLGSVGLLIQRRVIPSWRELGAGVLIGACNALQVVFLLRTLERLPAFLTFAISSAGGLLVTAAMAVGMLGERLAPRRTGGVALAAAALVLLQAR